MKDGDHKYKIPMTPITRSQKTYWKDVHAGKTVLFPRSVPVFPVTIGEKCVPDLHASSVIVLNGPKIV